MLAAGACAPPAPADPAFVDQWTAAADAATARAEPAVRARLAALGALAMYEAFAAEDASPVRSLAGQVNGLWSVPLSAGTAIDGAIAAAEAQRVLFAGVLPADSGARHSADSLAAAQVAARRAAGVKEQVAARSLSHGGAIGRALLALAQADAQRTLVLRHPQECAYRAVPARTADVVPQGAAATTALAPLLAAVESRLTEALVAADSVAAGRRAADESCVRALVRGRIRTRAAPGATPAASPGS